MNDKEQVLHDLVNKLTTISSKTRRLKKRLSDEELMELLELEEAKDQALKLVEELSNLLDD